MGELFDAQAGAPAALEPPREANRDAADDRAPHPPGEPAAASEHVEAPQLSAETEPPRASAGDVLDAVNQGFERVQAIVEERYALDRFREAQIDKLHAELQDYKADLVAKAVRPVLQSLMRLHDDLGKVLDALSREDAAAVTRERLLSLLEGFREDVEIALDRNGVGTFTTEAEEFDPRRQKVVRTVETSEQALAGRLAARVRPGFEQGEAILEKERVAVYVLAAKTDGEEVSA